MERCARLGRWRTEEMTDWDGLAISERIEKVKQEYHRLAHRGDLRWDDFELGRAAAYQQMRYERTVRSRQAFEDGLADLKDGEPIELLNEPPRDPAKFASGWRAGLRELQRFLD